MNLSGIDSQLEQAEHLTQRGEILRAELVYRRVLV